MTPSVLITRPVDQGQALQQAIERLGIKTTHLPLLEIDPLAETQVWQNIRTDLDHYDTLIAISPNAATLGMQYLSEYWPQWPSHLAAWGVGETTANILKDWGLAADHPTPSTSEGLIAALELCGTIHKCLILKGQGGRETLEQWLAHGNTQVDSLALYKRSANKALVSQARPLLNPKPDLICISSGEALEVFTKLKNYTDTDIFQISLLVSSARLAKIARELGFKVYQASGADTQAQINAIKQILKLR